MVKKLDGKKILLVRHGETAWSISGRHTSKTDLPLVNEGVEQAKQLRTVLMGKEFSTVLSSPMQRALQTCNIAGYGDRVEVCQTLMEWDYGDYEGLTTVDIRQRRPAWSLWHDGAPGGESPEDVAQRADKAIRRLLELPMDILVFSHAHFLRVLASRWINMDVTLGERLPLFTASMSTLGFQYDLPVILSWNTRI